MTLLKLRNTLKMHRDNKRIVKKGWGHELIWCSNDLYCGKHMVFEKAGSKFSMHFHSKKHETWIVQKGSFIVKWIDTKDATVHETLLEMGDVWENTPFSPHQLIALEDHSVIEEVSTHDDPADNYRVFPGDSQ